MASEERRAADQKIKDDNLFHSLGAEEQQAETDAFQCSRCKQVYHKFILVLILSMTHIELHRESVAIVKRRRGALMSLWQYVTSFSDPQLYTHRGLLDICNVCEHMTCVPVSWLIVTLWNYRCTNCNNRWTLWFTPRMRLTDRRL